MPFQAVVLWTDWLGFLLGLGILAATASVRGPEQLRAVGVWGVRDLVLEPLRTRREKTYSAPLATHLYAKEMIELPDGGQAREFPRLKYGGAQLQDPERDWAGAIARTALGGVAGGAV